MRPEFYDALIGAQPGETRTVTVQYAEDEAEESLRGQNVTYTFVVKNVQERLLPDWDELPTLTEFEGDFEALRTSARERLERASEDKARRAVIDEFLKQVGDATPIEIPEAMVADRAGEMFHQQVAEFQRYGISEEQFLKLSNKTHEEAVAEFMPSAEQDVHRSLIVREIIRREGLTLSPDDLATEQERFLDDFGPERRDEVLQMLQQPNMQQMVASAALDRKLRDRIVAIATGEAIERPVDAASAAREEQAMDATDAAAEGGPRVLGDVASGSSGLAGADESVFSDPGPDPSSATGTSSVEQATVANYGQKNTPDTQLDEEPGSDRSTEA